MTKQELKKFSEVVTTIKSITRVYEQAAARKMQMVKLEIESIKEYLTAATGTYSSTKYAVGEGKSEKVRQAILSRPFRNVTKNEVLVFIASQSQYFGNLIPSLAKAFVAEYQKTSADSIVLGKIGWELVQKNVGSAPNITYLDFDDTSPSWQVVHDVSQKVSAYAKVVVFFGEYKSVLTQEAKSEDISQRVVIHDVKEHKKYLFRPQPGLALSYLEQQMIAGGVLEKVYESQVAKYAARIKILEIGQVAQKISDAVEGLARGKRNLRKSTNNKKQMQLFTGSSLWQEEGIVA